MQWSCSWTDDCVVTHPRILRAYCNSPAAIAALLVLTCHLLQHMIRWRVHHSVSCVLVMSGREGAGWEPHGGAAEEAYIY